MCYSYQNTFYMHKNAQYKNNVFCYTILCLNQHNLAYLGQAEQRKKASMQFFLIIFLNCKSPLLDEMGVGLVAKKK